MITVENLSFTYRKSKRAVLHDFSLSFESGRVYGLLGKNGAGKSTLLYLMSGLLTPKNGKVMFHDTDVRRRLPVTLQDMFLVPEEFELPSVSLVSYVELNSPFYPRFSKEEMIKYLHYFEMDIDIDLGSLSMGQKKKVFMSFALATNTSLLLMDEPTNGLDPIGIAEMRNFIKELSVERGKTILISSHILSEIALLADDIGIIDHGLLLEENSMKELKKKNRKYILLQVSDVSKAALILEHQFHLVDYSVHDDQTLRIYDTCLDMAEINKALIVQDIAVISSQVCNDTLEDYFKKITGGEGIA